MIPPPFLDVTSARNTPRGWRWTISVNLIVAAVYAATGFAGLKLAFVGQAVTLFWPPSGIAFAALFLGGMRLLPGVWLGAFLVNIPAMGTAPLALMVAISNMVPGIVATLLLRRWIGTDREPGELRRVLWFILVAALGTTMLSATFGTLAVLASGSDDLSVQSTWLVWWMGDAMGVLIVAPPILLWRRIVTTRFEWRDLFDAVAFAIAGFSIIAGLMLIDNPIWAVELCKLCTLLLSLWTGIRFGLNGPAAMTLLMALGGVGVTLAHAGPFARGDFYDSFALLHSYLFAEAVAGMLLAAALADLKRTALAEAVARQQAEAAGENRVRLLTMISHDVRTPLGGIMSVFQALERSPLDPDQARLVQLGRRAGRTLTALVTDILDVARADAGRITLQPATFPIAQCIADVVDINRDAAQARALNITLSGVETLPAHLIGDQVRIEQLVGNLVGNAIAYTARGGVAVRAAWLPESPRPLVIEVIDTGPGIDPAQVPHLFNAFSLAPRAGNRSAGLGLGLHICHRLVALMEGTIAYRPAEGGGSAFRVELPLAPALAQVPASAEAVGDPPRRILLVEDDAVTREVTTALLQRIGHTVIALGDSEDIMATVRSVPFDIVLLDIMLDGRDIDECGIDMARALRADLTLPQGLRILAFTADAVRERIAEFVAAGFDGVLVKPIDLSHGLAAAVERAMTAIQDSAALEQTIP